jgi:hypothetical protein
LAAALIASLGWADGASALATDISGTPTQLRISENSMTFAAKARIIRRHHFRQVRNQHRTSRRHVRRIGNHRFQVVRHRFNPRRSLFVLRGVASPIQTSVGIVPIRPDFRFTPFRSHRRFFPVLGSVYGPYMCEAPSSLPTVSYYGYSNPHEAWCKNHYQTYDPMTDSFLGCDGYRHQCVVPN